VSLIFLLVGVGFLAYPFLVWRNFGGWGGAFLGVVTGGLGFLAGLAFLISGGSGVARAIRRHRSRGPSK
jgi:hypothetical protein